MSISDFLKISSNVRLKPVKERSSRINNHHKAIARHVKPDPTSALNLIFVLILLINNVIVHVITLCLVVVTLYIHFWNITNELTTKF